MTVLTAVSAGGNWSAAATWSPAQTPTAADDCVINASSGNVTVDTGATRFCRSLDCTGFTGTLTITSSLNIGTSTVNAANTALVLVSGMTVSGAGTVSFVSSNATQQTIDFASKTFTSLNFSGTGSSYLFNSAVTLSSSLNHTAGTVNTNGFAVTALQISSSGATVRTLTLGSSAISVSATAGWTISGSNLSLNAGTSTITMTGTTPTFAGLGLTYYNVTFTNATSGAVTVTGANTFNNFTVVTAVTINQQILFAANQTINGTLTAAGISASVRTLIASTVVGTQITLTVAALSLAWVDIQDIAGAGSSGWSLASITGGSGDCGNNSGITFTTSISQTVSLTAANVTWVSYGWATRVPLPQDDVVVVNAAAAARTLTFLASGRTCHNIDYSGITSTFTTSTSNQSTLFGNFTGVSTLSIGSGLAFSGRGTQTITWNSTTCNAAVTISTGNGTVRLLSNITVGSTVSLTSGTWDLNGFTATVTAISTTGAITRSISFNGGTINCTITTASNMWTASGSNFTTSGTGTIAITTTSANTRTFAGGGFSYPDLQYIVTSSSGILSITGNNSFNGIQFSDTVVRTLQFANGSTTTIRTASSWDVHGAVGTGVTMKSATTTTTWSLVCASGVISSDALNLYDSHASGGASFYAGANSVDDGNNTGWSFTAAPTGGTFTVTQTAMSRIAVNGAVTQTATGRVAVNLTRTQAAVARIATLAAKTQTAIARVTANVVKTQPAIARVATNRAVTQSAIARISRSYSLTQTAIARLTVSRTKTQTATARVATKRSFTQTAIANITTSAASSKTQTAIARIATNRLVTQSAKARISQVKSSTQTATARIASKRTATQLATARVTVVKSLTQTATAKVAINSYKTQMATARIIALAQKQQTATARVKVVRIKTQTAMARISGGTLYDLNIDTDAPKDTLSAIVEPIGIEFEVSK